MEDDRASINSINIFIAHYMRQIGADVMKVNRQKIMYSVICRIFIFDGIQSDMRDKLITVM